MRINLQSAGMILIIFLVASCMDKPSTQQTIAAVPVGIYTAEPGDATYFDLYPATVTPLNQVEIKPQVSGNIIAVFFQDGQQVNKGQKIYEIDQQQYKGAYEQAIANMNVAKSNLAKSQQDADRYQELAKQDAIAKQLLDHQMADLETAKRQVEAAQANVSSVQTNLKYSVIYSPLNGTIGISLVKIGTSVYPQTLLNTISSDDPMAVDIAIDQAEINHFSAYLQSKQDQKDSTFTLVLPDGSIHPYPGKLVLLDRSVDPQTGTIKARLVFSNPKKNLKPGITTNLRVKHNAGDSSLLIPTKALLEQLGEYYVYVVNSDNKVTQHKVGLGAKINDKIVIKTGIQKGDKVVIEGIQKLRDSTSVQIGMPKAKPSK